MGGSVCWLFASVFPGKKGFIEQRPHRPVYPRVFGRLLRQVQSIPTQRKLVFEHYRG
jgi:hypothetical protein